MGLKSSFSRAFLALQLAALVAGQGGQFITGPCDINADCASGCCGLNSGTCASPAAATENDGGCRLAKGRIIPRQGKQFITGVCTGDVDCASGCCGFNTGKCAGAIIAQERDGGCGFGDGQPNDDAARKLRGQPPAQGPAATNTNDGDTATPTGSNKAPGAQFITGVCASDAECASGCCGFNTGKCAGPVIAQERDGGCGFGNNAPNADAVNQRRRSVRFRG
ncbi:MAG: hypothetical protein M1840_006467 [Geoglossum simile]|nr:MAG: hypothetical protein M1840_006467 [Geoglossum simile]